MSGFKDSLKKCFDLIFRKNKRIEKRFTKVWSGTLNSDAEVFTGLYASLEKISEGSAKKPEKAFNEWRTRTRYKWENEPVYKITEEFIAANEENNALYKKWADLLLKAADGAGIDKDAKGVITLDERSAGAYKEWDGEELFESDTAEIITPAHYQNNKVIEQGYCRKNVLI